MTIYERLIELQKELGFDTLKAFAENAGFSPKTISNKKNRGGDLDFEVVGKLLKTYPRINHRWLFFEEGKPLLEVTDVEQFKEHLFPYNSKDKLFNLLYLVENVQDLQKRVDSLEHRVLNFEKK